QGHLSIWHTLLLLQIPQCFCLPNTIYLFIKLQACDKDLQCGGSMCCAISLWIRSLRMCTPMGDLGEECHPLSNKVIMLLHNGSTEQRVMKVPFLGRRMHHTCPCLPNLACLRISPSRFKCLPEFRNEDVFF
uniref:Prokineticin 2 n=1 Tax=Gopherus evgoodei TaxID=1825980 RepID=A0A8C4YJ36_9SAUR